jgi:hypothetical protein
MVHFPHFSSIGIWQSLQTFSGPSYPQTRHFLIVAALGEFASIILLKNMQPLLSTVYSLSIAHAHISNVIIRIKYGYLISESFSIPQIIVPDGIITVIHIAVVIKVSSQAGAGLVGRGSETLRIQPDGIIQDIN